MQPQDPYGQQRPSQPPAQPPYPVPPEQPLPQQPAVPDDPTRYAFFMEERAASKKTPLGNLSKKGGGFGMRIAFIVGGAVVLMLILGGIVALLPKGGNVQNLIDVAQAQNELIRVASLGTNGGRQQPVRNLAQNVSLSTLTSQQKLVAALAKHGTKLDAKKLGLTKNARTDQTLVAAKSASNFDEVFTNTMRALITDYSNKAKKAYSTTKLTDEKQLLSEDYADAQLLLTEVSSITN